jgi:hypothetical protein
MYRGSRAWSQWGVVHRFHVLLACRKFWFSNIPGRVRPHPAGDREAKARAAATDLREDKPATVHQSGVWQWCSGCQDMVPKAEFSKTQQKKSRDVAKCKTCIATHTHPNKRRCMLELAAWVCGGV